MRRVNPQVSQITQKQKDARTYAITGAVMGTHRHLAAGTSASFPSVRHLRDLCNLWIERKDVNTRPQKCLRCRLGVLGTALAVLVALAEVKTTLFGSGPFFERAVFYSTAYPDYPRTQYARGDLGILQSTYWRMYLFIAYRYLAGKGFTPREQQALEVLWDPKVKYDWMNVVAAGNEQHELEGWQKARSKVRGSGPGPNIEVYRGGFWDRGHYIGYLNCPGDAFRNAAETLNKRVEQFGADSPAIRDWVKAQDQVFANCNGPATLPAMQEYWLSPDQQAAQAAAAAAGPSIPAPAPMDSPPLLRADRAYQIAAANFYAGNLEAALRGFQAIAADSASPWHGLAAYLAARTLVRQGTLEPGPGEVNKTALEQAQTELKAMLSNTGLLALHAAATRLLDLVRLKLDPEQRLGELAVLLSEGGSAENLTQSVEDYTALLDKYLSGPTDAWPRRGPAFKDVPAFLRQNPLTDWISTLQSGDEDALHHAIEEWKKERSLPWLVTVISKIQAGDPDEGQVLAAARLVEPSSPAYLTVAYHTARLAIASRKEEQVREMLDRLLIERTWKEDPSALNLFLAQRLKLARSLDEFLKFAPRTVGSYGWSDEGNEFYQINPESDPRLKGLARERVLFDTDSTKVLNEGMPLSLLQQAATSKLLSPYLHRQLALAVWVRAFLLGNEQIARDLVPVVEAAAPELKESLEAYRTAKDAESRRFAAVYTILKFPGLRPYVNSGTGRLERLDAVNSLRDDWWCKLVPGIDFDFPNYEKINAELVPNIPKSAQTQGPSFAHFLTGEQKEQARDDLKRLAAIGPGTDYLGGRILAWAKNHPDDPRLPEALHRVVSMPHLGCSDAETGSNSQAAFEFLHQRYPNNPWTKKTKYWYH